jgi:hypothetical protein
MRRVAAILGVVAMAVLTASAAHGQFHFGMNYFDCNNWDNGGGDGSGPAFQPGGWTATTDGALWTRTGSTYALNAQDVNMRLDFRLSPTSPWQTVTNTILVSNGVAYQDVNMGGYVYPGYWYCQQADPNSPCHMGNGQYYLPGTYDPVDYPDGRPTQTGMQFNLYVWSGSFNTFADAVAGGAQVGISGPFQVGPTMYWISPMEKPFIYMPSTVMAHSLPGDANLDGTVNINDLSKVLTNYDKTGQIWADGDFSGDGSVDISDLSVVLAHYDQTATAAGAGIKAVPEPSTLLLTAAGLAGLLAYARRRRR